MREHACHIYTAFRITTTIEGNIIAIVVTEKLYHVVQLNVGPLLYYIDWKKTMDLCMTQINYSRLDKRGKKNCHDFIKITLL